MNSTGERIKSLRMALNMSMRDVGALCPNVTYAYLSRIESNERAPSQRALHEIAAALGTSAIWLEWGDGNHTCPYCNSVVEATMLATVTSA